MQSDDVLQGLIKSVSELNRQISESVSIIQSALSSTITQELVESITQTFSKFCQPIERLHELDFKPFVECGICLAPSMTPNVINIAIERYEQGKKQTIPSLFEGFYRKNKYQLLRHAVSQWESKDFYFQRMHIFHDALEAHIAGKWTLSVPALLPHIEGIARDLFKANILPVKEVTNKKKRREKFPDTLLLSSKIKKEDTIKGFVTAIMNYYFKILYDFVDFNVPETRKILTLNRHAVLHGYRYNYATRTNSLRCFLALDSLSMLVEPNKVLK